MNLNQVTLPCQDYDASVAFYRLLGFQQIVDSPPRYARFETSSGTTFSLHHDNKVPNVGVVVYFEVDDVDAKVGELTGLGVKFDTDAVDQNWLWREAYLRDPAGNQLCIYNAGKNRRFPPWRIDEKQDRNNE